MKKKKYIFVATGPIGGGRLFTLEGVLKKVKKNSGSISGIIGWENLRTLNPSSDNVRWSFSGSLSPVFSRYT